MNLKIHKSKKSKNIRKALLVYTLFLILINSSDLCFAKNQPIIRPKIGLALGGGGARGAAHIGVLRVLEREQIPVDYLVGTSAGALIAALYSGGSTPDEIEKYAISGAIRNAYKTDITIFRALFIHMNRVFKTFWGKPFYAGLYNDHKLHHFVNQAIASEDGDINIQIPLHILAVDLITGLPVVIKSGDVGLAVQASTAIPGLRQPIPISDQLLIDGGVLRNIPIDEAKKMGSDLVIAIDVDSQNEIYRHKDFKSFENTITRVINLGLKAQSEHILEKADILIKPDLVGVNILDLDSKSLEKAITAGEEAAMKKIPEIKRKLELKERQLKKEIVSSDFNN